MWKRVTQSQLMSGTHLQCYLDTDRSTVVALLGAPDEGFWDDEKGYDGEEWYYLGPNGEPVTVYARWGSYRIGGLSREAAQAFREWAGL